MVGLQDLRDNPWQIQLIFNGLLSDPYTKDIYGQKVIQKATDWFLKTNIPVVFDFNLVSSPAMPLITVGLNESNEESPTLGDLHYVTGQSTEAVWEPTTQKFSAAYDPVTGLVTPSIDVIANSQMVLVDGAGIRHPVIDVQVDSNDKEKLLIEKGLVTDFSNCVLEWSTNKLSVQLESCWFKESYTVGTHTKGETDNLLYLWAIAVYILLRYKKTLLEGRGFECSTIASTKVMPNTSLSPVGSENFWSRFITVTGKVKNSWATLVSERIASAAFANPSATGDGMKASQINFLPNSFRTDDTETDPSWMASDGVGISL
jgi:hypothetical protein